ncbi:hypothetical protein KUCAC02_017464 [Chaenocephalus aceratus]|uniref:Uncharacterized protein n=1 Tax=Chaenocephalus aceratus TaxID=36190 RepID=A0ACB9W1A7_CHAAC|nr:hypothetical protein KUCAC02_017464 [Chaenocephalus aceratus]
MRGAVLLLLLFCVSAEGGGVDRGSQSSVLAEREIWSELSAIKNMVGEQEVELQTHRDNVASLEKENRALVSRVSASEEQLTALRAELEVSKNEIPLTRNTLDETGMRSSGTKVAFSAALSPGKFGPYNTETPLVYRRSITNLGGAYSSNTGAQKSKNLNISKETNKADFCPPLLLQVCSQPPSEEPTTSASLL